MAKKLAIFVGCRPFPGYDRFDGDCDEANSAVYRHIEERGYDLVVLNYRLPTVTQSDLDAGLISYTAGATLGSSAEAGMLALVERGIGRLLATGALVIGADPIPEPAIDIGAYARKKLAFDQDFGELDETTTLGAHQKRTAAVAATLDSVDGDRFIRIRPADALCSAGAGLCYGTSGGRPLYIDDNHLSAFGVEEVLPLFRQAFDAADARVLAGAADLSSARSRPTAAP